MNTRSVVPSPASDWRQNVAAIGVVVTIATGTGVAGLLIGRNQLAERVAIIEQRLSSHEMVGLHPGAVSQREYLVTVDNMAANIADIKESIRTIQATLARDSLSR